MGSKRGPCQRRRKLRPDEIRYEHMTFCDCAQATARKFNLCHTTSLPQDPWQRLACGVRRAEPDEVPAEKGRKRRGVDDRVRREAEHCHAQEHDDGPLDDDRHVVPPPRPHPRPEADLASADRAARQASDVVVYHRDRLGSLAPPVRKRGLEGREPAPAGAVVQVSLQPQAVQAGSPGEGVLAREGVQGGQAPAQAAADGRWGHNHMYAAFFSVRTDRARVHKQLLETRVLQAARPPESDHHVWVVWRAHGALSRAGAKSHALF